MSRRVFVIAWIAFLFAIAIVAAAAVGATSGALRDAIAFEPLHVVAHIALYAVLGAALVGRSPPRVARVLAIVVAVGVVQEYAQTLVASRALTADAVFDVGMDLLGGILGMVAETRRRPGSLRRARRS